MPEPLCPGVGLDELELIVRPTGEGEVVDGDLVDREDGAGGAILRAHVADRGPGLETQARDAGSVGLHELADDPVATEQLGDGEHHIGGGHALTCRAGELEPDDRRDEHRRGLAEHGGLGLDATDAPPEHPETVDHRRVRVGADHRVGIGDAVILEHDSRQVLDVDLVADAHAGRDHSEAVEGSLRPPKQLVALEVALVLDCHVLVHRGEVARVLDDDRVVDDQLDRDERVDPAGVATELDDGVAHRCQVDDCGHPCQVLHEHPFWAEGDLASLVARCLAVPARVRAPCRQRPDVVCGDLAAVLMAQEVLQEDLDREGERCHLGGVEPWGVQGEVVETPVPHREGGASVEAVGVGRSRCHGPILRPAAGRSRRRQPSWLRSAAGHVAS